MVQNVLERHCTLSGYVHTIGVIVAKELFERYELFEPLAMKTKLFEPF